MQWSAVKSRDDASLYLTSRLQPVPKRHDTVYDFVRNGRGYNPVLGYANSGLEHTLYQDDRGVYCFDVRPELSPGERSGFPNAGMSPTFEGLIEGLLDTYWPNET